MNSVLAIRRIRKHHNEWRRSGESVEVSWTVRGLEIALNELRALAKEERGRHRTLRPFVPQRFASDLYFAVRSAYRDLDHGKRPRAMLTLTKAMEKVKMRCKNAALSM